METSLVFSELPIGNSLVFGQLGLHRAIGLHGFTSARFGTHYIQSDRIDLFGFSSARFGNGFVQSNYINLPGFSSARFGVGTVYNLTQILYLQGVSAAHFGVGRIQSNNIDLPGFNSARFGVGTAYNANQHVTLSGFSSARVGFGKIHSSYINLPGVSSARFGTGWLSYGNRDIYQYYPLVFNGSAWVPSPPVARFGVGRFNHTWVACPGISSARFGVGRFSQGEQVIYLMSAHSKLFGPRSEMTRQHREVQLHGFSSAQFGALSTDPTYVYLEGINPLNWSSGSAMTHAEVRGISAGRVGNVGFGRMSYTPIVVTLPSLGDTARFGNSPYGMLHQFNQAFDLQGFDNARFQMDDWDFEEAGHFEITDYVYPQVPTFARVGAGAMEHSL